MAYSKQSFKDGEVLTASHLNKIESGIYTADVNASKALKNANVYSFKGKKLLVTGDSITERNFRASKLWHDYLKEWLGLDSVQNDGLSGSGLVKNNGIVYRLAKWSKYGTPDMILIMGNMNDGTSSLAGQPATGDPEWFGKFEDQDDTMKDQYMYPSFNEVTVDSSYVNTTGIVFKETPTVSIGNPVQWYANVLPSTASNPTIIWTASDDKVTLTPAIESFGASCTITGVSAGECTITITSEDGGFVKSKTIIVS